MNRYRQEWIPLTLGMIITFLSILILFQDKPASITGFWQLFQTPSAYFLAFGMFIEGLGLISLTRSRLMTGVFGLLLIIQGLAGLTLYNIQEISDNTAHTYLFENELIIYLPSLSVCFALVGLVYLIISFYGYTKKYIIIANIILSLTTLLTFLSVFNELYTEPYQNIWLQIPYQSGIGFILIAISCFILLWNKRRINGYRGSTLNAIICGIASFTLFAVLSLSFKNTTIEQKKQTAQLQAKILKNTLSSNIEDQVDTLFQFINSINKQDNSNNTQQIKQISKFLEFKSFVESITIHTNNDKIIHIDSPLYKGITKLPKDILAEKTKLDARADLKYKLTLISNDTAVIFNTNNDYIIVNYNDLIKSIWLRQYFIDPIEIEILHNNQTIYSTFKSENLVNSDILDVSDELEIFGTKFIIKFKINTWYFEHNQPNFSLIFFIFGFFISILFVLLIRAREISNYRLNSLYKTIKALRKAKRNLKKITRIDYLTGISNRSAMMEQLEIEISKSKRNESKFAVMFIDIDNFKQINDIYGHHCGDSILKEVTSRLLVSIRKSDYISRFAGDEFIILATDIKEYAGIEVLASRCINAFKKPFSCNDNLIEISPSIGISSYPKCGNTADELIKHADIAMYKAKQQGKNNFKIFNDDINNKLLRQFDIKTALAGALARNEFSLEYQPIFELKNNQVIGIEALLRWNNSTLNNPNPIEFIPLAEMTRTFNPIGNWVFKQAISDYAKIQENINNKVPLFLSINISQVQLLDDDTFNNLYKILNPSLSNNIPIIFEVKESAAMQNIELIKSRLQTLQLCNVQIALDDFAKVDTSLKNINALPIRYVKIDQGIITQINCSDQANKTIEGILALTKELGIAAIAKGVETGEQVMFLKKNACSHIQGYTFSKPLTVKALIKYLTTIT